jgi:predicted Rossmann fold flavoprotein
MVIIMIYDVLIIGGGAAGLMAARLLDEASINYLLLEKNDRVGKKLLISGNKRCNVTNNLDVESFMNRLTIRNKSFLYPALYTFGPSQVVRFFKDNGCELVLENNFKYFPKSNRSQSIIDAIIKPINKARFKFNQVVTSITKDAETFIVKTKEQHYHAKTVIVATGSCSFPSTGSSGDGLKFANDFGIKYTDFTPAETHIHSDFIVKEYKQFQGVAISDTTVQIVGTNKSEQGDVLFTHFGLSGPAIYHLSEEIYQAIKEGHKSLRFSLSSLPESTVRSMLNESDLLIFKQLAQMTTKRIANKILEECHIENRKIAELSKKQINDVIDMVMRFTVPITKVEDKERAYVNKGGISLKALNPNSMETKDIPNLFFVGETTNLHGPIGGFNITIAFATAHLAADELIQRLK